MHIAAIGVSYAAFTVASVAAMLYLVQNNAIKMKRPGVVLNRLPGLSFLDKLIYRSIGLGFPILTFAILTGIIWANHLYGSYRWNYNVRQISTVVLWLVYALILHVRLSDRMRGRRIAFLSLAAFLVILLSVFGACR